MLKRLVVATIILATLVVALGAYTRLKDAGLGCPDWPGCYGQLTVPGTIESINQANAAYPERPVEPEKAWIEMVHRYFASTLGLMILGIAYLAYRQKKNQPDTPVALPLVLVGLVIFQGILGMWTVTLGLYPPAVMGHLLGGFATLSLLWLLHLKLKALPTPHQTHSHQNNTKTSTDTRQNTPKELTRESSNKPIRRLQSIAITGLVLLTLQIALGGWTSSNYAAIACTEFPICQGDWSNHLNVQEAFKIFGTDEGQFEYGMHLDPTSKVTIHIFHRIGAIVVTIALLILGLVTLNKSQNRYTRTLAVSMLCLLALQVSLGLSNIIFLLPLAVAVAHNVVALLLLLNLITLTVAIRGEMYHGTFHHQIS